MVNVQKFLLENVDNEDGTYALVFYNGVVEPTWFSKYYDDESNKDWFLESPCTLMKTPIEEDDIDAFLIAMWMLYIKVNRKKENITKNI